MAVAAFRMLAPYLFAPFALTNLIYQHAAIPAVQNLRSMLAFPIMYGPPQDCKGKFGREDKSAQMYSAFEWRLVLLAMMSCARVCPSKSVGRLKTIFGIRLRTRRYDCSFVLAAPMQTLMGNFSRPGGRRGYAGMGL
jgi:hypothetical protein